MESPWLALFWGSPIGHGVRTKVPSELSRFGTPIGLASQYQLPHRLIWLQLAQFFQQLEHP